MERIRKAKPRLRCVVTSLEVSNRNGPLEAKVVEEVFVRLSKIVVVLVRGQEIRTTLEHPFWVLHKGWTEAWKLTPDDLLISADGQYVPVSGLRHTEDWETVYNLRVADFHTYFVGTQTWGFSVWVHNAEYTIVKIEGTQAWTILNEAGEVVPVAAGKKFGNPANAAKFAEGAGIENVKINKGATWSADGGLKGMPVKHAGAEVKMGTGHTETINTPQGPVEVHTYAGGYDAGSKRLGLDRHHQAGAAVLSGDAQVALQGNWPGVTVYDFPSQKVLIWNNKSGALPTPLTSGEQRAIQRGLEGAFPGRQVIFDDTRMTILKKYRAELISGGAK